MLISLNDFIIYDLNKYHIPVNKKNIAKLRNRFTKELKYKKLWENAQTKTIERAKTKLFEKQNLENISNSDNVNTYLTKLALKQIGLTEQKFKKLKEKHQIDYLKKEKEWQDELRTHTQEENEWIIKNKITLTQEEKENALNSLMIKAIFDKFYTMTDEQKKLFYEDYKSKKEYPENTYNNNNWLISQQRLKKPEKYYYSSKEKTAQPKD